MIQAGLSVKWEPMPVKSRLLVAPRVGFGSGDNARKREVATHRFHRCPMQQTDDNATAQEVEAATKSVKMIPRPSGTPSPKRQRRGRVGRYRSVTGLWLITTQTPAQPPGAD